MTQLMVCKSRRIKEINGLDSRERSLLGLFTEFGVKAPKMYEGCPESIQPRDTENRGINGWSIPGQPCVREWLTILHSNFLA